MLKRYSSVAQVIDTLHAGGAERMSVQLANHLTELGWTSYLCVTRQSGLLMEQVDRRVNIFMLNRRYRYDILAIYKLAQWVRANEIDVVHAHGSSSFVCAAAALLHPFALVFHDHEGESEYVNGRNRLLYRMLASKLSGVVVVNNILQQWFQSEVGCNPPLVRYIRNYSVVSNARDEKEYVFEGRREHRIVCLANLRPQKDHVTLLRAFRLLLDETDIEYMLYLVGDITIDKEYTAKIRDVIVRAGLERNVIITGAVSAPSSILNECRIGVLSSRSEGLPLALLEYGLSGLCVVSTDVGQCAEVLDHGEAGVLVPRSNETVLAGAMKGVLRDSKRSECYSKKLHARVLENYSKNAAMLQITDMYEAFI